MATLLKKKLPNEAAAEKISRIFETRHRPLAHALSTSLLNTGDHAVHSDLAAAAREDSYGCDGNGSVTSNRL